ncbi:3-dehydroquinate synthase [compost metagenome]
MTKPSSLVFIDSLPTFSQLGEEVLVIYDQILVKKIPGFKAWLKKAQATYAVKAGEDLKAIEKFSSHISHLTKISEGLSSRRLTIVVVGGGSVGDFGGFVASVFKRGVRLVHIPSTWLAAIDSAHGGKTGLNVAGVKNQIGTFYPADKIFLVGRILKSQPEGRAFEGFGELLKIALIKGGSLWSSLAKENSVNGQVLWKYLPQAIKGKLSIVAQDPEEKSGLRHVLNLGHTMGHVFESHYDLPHGVAINYGVRFALEWSVKLGLMKERDFEMMMSQPVMAYLLSAQRDDLLSGKEKTLKAFKKILLSDKKKTKSQSLRFVFLKKPGQFVIKEVNVEDILIEVCRQKESDLYE